MRDLKRALTRGYLALYFVGLLSLSITFSANAIPYRPASDTEVIDVLPKGSLTFQKRSPSQTTVKPAFSTIEPQVTALLAQSYTLGDPRALGQAEALLEPYRQDSSAQIRLLRANIYQASHRFDQAKQELQAILKQTPNQPDSLLLLSSIDLVQGNFVQARQSCDQIADMSLLIIKMGCIAQVEAMTGRLKQSAMTVQQLLQINNGLDVQQQRWLALMLADMALRLNDDQMALIAFTQLNQFNSAPSLAAKADWLLAHREWHKVKQLLENYTDNDSLLLRLLMSELHLKDVNAQAHFKLLGDRIQVWSERGEFAHQREQAQYTLLYKDPSQALELARLNWKKQRETADVVVYADAAIRNKSKKDLQVIKNWIRETGFEYPILTQALARAEYMP